MGVIRPWASFHAIVSRAGAPANAYPPPPPKIKAPHGYFEVPHTPGLWKHIWRPVQFSLVVDDFSVKYIGKEHTEHLVAALKEDFTLSTDWEGNDLPRLE